MGLIYSSGDSSALVSALSANLLSAKTKLESTESACDQLGNALGGGELSGKGYAAVGSLFSQVVKPSVSNAKTMIGEIQTDLDSYTQADALVSQYGSLNEDELEAQLASVRAQRDATEQQIETNRTTIATLQSVPVTQTWAVSLELNTTRLEGVLAGLEDDIREIKKKLKALRDFDAQTSGQFVDRLWGIVAVAGDMLSLLHRLKSPGGFDLFLAANKTLDVTKMYRYLAGREVTETVKVVSPSLRQIERMQRLKPWLSTSHTYRHIRLDGTTLYERSTRDLTNPGRAFNAATGARIEFHQDKLSLGLKAALQTSLSAGRAASWGSIKDTLKDFDWRDTTKLSKFGKFLGAAGTVITVGANANKYFGDGEVSVTDVRDFAIDTAVDVGSAAAAAGIGAAAGSFFLPPVGTIVGAGVGLGVNVLLNTEFPFLGGKSAVEAAKDGLKSLANGVQEGAKKAWDWIGSKFW